MKDKAGALPSAPGSAALAAGSALTLRLMPDLEGEAMATATRMITTILSDRLGIWRRFGII